MSLWQPSTEVTEVLGYYRASPPGRRDEKPLSQVSKLQNGDKSPHSKV
jgi:hypothetical protein